MVFYLIDGNAFCYRAFHAVRELRNSKGEPTNVVFGFSMMMRKIIDDYKPDGLCVAFDTKGPTFRHKKFEDYKSHRKPMPDDLVRQMPVVKRLVKAYSIPAFEKEGFEADDIIGTLCKRLTKAGHEAVIVTGDKDMLQLVNSHVKVLNPQKDFLVYDSKEVEARFGVKPNQVVDVLALMGDASDFIPGVPGIGEKTALALVQEFGSLDKIFARLDQVKPESKRKAIEENRDSAVLSRELAVIDLDVPFDAEPKDLIRKEPDWDEVRTLYTELEFRSFLKELQAEEAAPAETKKGYRLVVTKAEWEKLKKELEKAGEFALDFETTGLDAVTARPVGISFSHKPDEAAFVLFSTHKSGKSKLTPEEVLESARPLLENPKIKKTGQNLKYEMMILKQFGIDLGGVAFDTMLGSYLLNASKRNHNLGDLAQEHLRENLIPIERLIGKGKDQITMADADVDLLYRYGCQDSDVALRLTRILRKAIEEKGLEDLLNKIELPLVQVLADMETWGIAVDKPFLAKLSEELGTSIDKLTKKIYKTADGEFNINSPKQLSEILFTKLALRVVRRTKTGISTDVDVLTELADEHELPKLILDYRELAKLKSTYVDTMPLMMSPKDRRIHSSFNQTVTETGRLSSNDPNLQNIPVRTEEGRKVRRAFVAEKGRVLLSADYSQIELRVLAEFSGDKALKKAFKEGQDIHAYTAGLVFGVELKDVTPKMRETAKTVNFGVLYGMSPFGLAKALKITQDSARDFIKSYFERYPKVKGFLDETIESAKKKGYVETLFKRRRYIPDIASANPQIRQYAERTAINAPVQGTASDIIKIAMIEIHRLSKKFEYCCRMVLQVHDELVFEVEKPNLKEFAAVVKKGMEGAADFDVPIEAVLKAGPNWMDMERLK